MDSLGDEETNTTVPEMVEADVLAEEPSGWTPRKLSITSLILGGCAWIFPLFYYGLLRLIEYFYRLETGEPFLPAVRTSTPVIMLYAIAPVLGYVAVAVALKARRRLKAEPDRPASKMAGAGLVLGISMLVVGAGFLAITLAAVFSRVA